MCQPQHDFKNVNVDCLPHQSGLREQLLPSLEDM